MADEADSPPLQPPPGPTDAEREALLARIAEGAVSGGGAAAPTHHMQRAELIVPDNEPRVAAPLHSLREMFRASNVFVTGLFTFCLGAFVGSWPAGTVALEALNSSPPVLPTKEGLRQLYIMCSSGPVAAIAAIFAVARHRETGRTMKNLQTGPRFLVEGTSLNPTETPAPQTWAQRTNQRVKQWRKHWTDLFAS